MNTFNYLETNSTDPRFNLAFEEHILSTRKDGDYLILWQNNKTVVVGVNQNTVAEINSDYVAANNIQVVRRMTGGGAVYHDMGNLNYSFITDVGDNNGTSMKRFTLPIVSILKELGLDAEWSGRNDILVSGRKVSGTAQRILNGRILHHGTLLYRSDLDAVASALNADPAKFKSNGTQSVRSRVANIGDWLPEMSVNNFWAYIKSKLSCDSAADASLEQTELNAVRELAVTKYSSWEWNYGRSPKSDFSSKRRWSGGTLQPIAELEAGRIKKIRFYGDFLSLESVAAVSDALVGCPFDRESVRHIISRFELSKYFGSIMEREILDTLFS